MNIKTKFKIGQTVFRLSAITPGVIADKIVRATIYVEHLSDNHIITYDLQSGQRFYENRLFASKKELMEAL